MVDVVFQLNDLHLFSSGADTGGEKVDIPPGAAWGGWGGRSTLE